MNLRTGPRIFKSLCVTLGSAPGGTHCYQQLQEAVDYIPQAGRKLLGAVSIRHGNGTSLGVHCD